MMKIKNLCEAIENSGMNFYLTAIPNIGPYIFQFIAYYEGNCTRIKQKAPQVQRVERGVFLVTQNHKNHSSRI